MFTCCIIDDDVHSRSLLLAFVKKTPELLLIEEEGAEQMLLQKITGGNLCTDITFLNTNLKDAAKAEQVLQIKDKTHIVLATAHGHYGPEAFLLNAVDYLLMPASYLRFLQAIEKIKRLIAPAPSIQKYIFIPGDKKGVKIKIAKDDILYIKSYANYIKIVTLRRQYLTYLSMLDILILISESSFIRVHKSYIVNLDKIDLIDPVSIVMECSTIIPIGSVYKEAFLQMVSGAVGKLQKEI